MGMSAPIWDKGFPPGYGNTSISYLLRCEEFGRAKRGDLSAARSVATKCVKLDSLLTLRRLYPDAVLLPVQRENALPVALAQAVGLPVCYDVYRSDAVQRKKLPAMERFLHRPVFCGSIKQGVSYIIIDDVVTQGGTVTALRDFVVTRGGKVVAVAALAFAGGSVIAPAEETLSRAALHISPAFWEKLGVYGITAQPAGLTDMQLKYLLSFRSSESIENKLEESAAKLSAAYKS